MKTLLVLLRKEFIQFRRNKFMPKLVVMFPMMAMLVIPLVTTMDVKNVNVAVVDADKSEISRRIVSDMQAAPYNDKLVTVASHHLSSWQEG